jgi:hypothetical protein
MTGKGASCSYSRQHQAIAVLILLASLVVGNVDLMRLSLTGPRHAKKQFTDFDSFYSFYLTEHTDIVCRRLHVIGTSIIGLIVLKRLRLVMPLVATGCIGYALMFVFFGIAHGFFEFGLMLCAYVALNKWCGNALLLCLSVPACGYAFAWVGHFFFELNKPASFIYPTFSLMSDFRLWYDVLSGAEYGLWS